MTSVSVTQDYKTVIVTEGPNQTTVVTSPSPAVTIETIGLGPQGPGGDLGLYANFIDTTDQPLVSTAAAQVLTLNTTLASRGISVVSNNRITFTISGTYKILASLQITNSGNSVTEINIFFKKNGTVVPNSNTRIDIESRKSVSAPYHGCFTIEFQLDLVPNDYVEIFWAADHSGIAIETIPADALHPQAPSAIVNVAQVLFAQAGELRLLHDVYTDLAADGDVLTWVDALNRWEAVKIPNAAPRSITIANPQPGDNFTIFRTDTETTISAVTALVSGTAPSVTYELRYASNRTSTGVLATVSETVTNSTIGDPATVQNQPIPADSYVWLIITAVSGTVGELNITVAF
jgi:hypothetical protein